jgi:hypothetical protein
MSATANVHELPVANRETMRDFLANIIAEHIHLVAMKPDDDQYPVGQWFGADADSAATWASTQNAIGKNVYWTVNRTREGLNKKPKKTDIVSARFAHVDLDPPKDGSPWDRAVALNGLTELDMPPSFVLDSGGGFGVFWRLEYAAENWPAIERLNQSLEDILGGDHCHNIDRLMRVPGTVNYPNAKSAQPAGTCRSPASRSATRARLLIPRIYGTGFPRPSHGQTQSASAWRWKASPSLRRPSWVSPRSTSCC